MDALILGTYILAWPFISLAVLLLIVTATTQELRRARNNGHDVV